MELEDDKNINDSNTLSILSYNILNKDFATQDRFPDIEDKHRGWDYRLPILRATITKYNSDIICLQEIDIASDIFKSDFGDYFNQIGYEYILPSHKPMKKHKHSQSKSKKSFHINWGNCILYKHKKYKCIYRESLNNNPRIMIALFLDLRYTLQCKGDQAKISIHHSFFVINVHLTGHPQRHMRRLNTMKRIIQRMDTLIDSTLKDKLNGNKEKIRIILCGDFNSPKTGLVDQLLSNQMIDYDQINICKVSKLGQDIIFDRRSVRFILDDRDICAFLRNRGALIKKVRNRSNAVIMIPNASTKTRLQKRILIVNGRYDECLEAVNMIINAIKSQSLMMCIDEENIKCLNIGHIHDFGGAKVHISAKNLMNSTERTIDISGDNDVACSTMQVVLKQMFESKSYIVTRMEYDPCCVLNASNKFRHCYEFKDAYQEGMKSYLKKVDCDDYHDRIQYFPSYGDGKMVGAMDFIYFTSNGIRLKGISQTVHNKETLDELEKDVEKEKQAHSNDDDDNGDCKEQGILSKALCLPNDKIVSDHLPVAAIFTIN